MACQAITNVALKGIASSVPYESRTLEDEYEKMGEAFVNRISAATGVVKRHISPPHICSTDLACAAISNLLTELNWDKGSIDCMILVTQTPDYLLPNSSSVIHHRLELSKQTIVLDVSMGCSGYVHGLWLVSNLLSTGQLKRGLIVVADTVSKIISETDHSYQLLFGDGASATALEYDETASTMYFNLGSDGSRFDSLILPSGLFRDFALNKDISLDKKNLFAAKANDKLNMDGADIMNFALEEIPKATDELFRFAGKNKGLIKYWVMHQANKVILSYLATKMAVPLEKILFSLDDFGNTSSVSIPLTLSHRLKNELEKQRLQLMLTAFGVGLAWSSVLLECANLVMPDIHYLK